MAGGGEGADRLCREVGAAEGTLDDAQRRTLLRLATAAAQAGDDATLTELRERDTARMRTGPLADMFRLLTAAQVAASRTCRGRAAKPRWLADCPAT